MYRTAIDRHHFTVELEKRCAGCDPHNNDRINP
jgi:hypothetical protein